MDKNALLAALAPKRTQFPIDGFGTVDIRQLSVEEVDDIRLAIKSDDAKKDEFGLRLVMLAVADDEGNRVFDEADFPKLRASSNVVMDKLVGKALEFNGFKKADAEKKSDETPSGDSVTV